MRWTRGTAIWSGIVAATLAVTVWASRDDPIPVDVLVVKPAQLRVTVDEPALTHLPHHDVVSAPTNGVVATVLRAGDSVALGAVVASLRPVPLDARATEESRAAAAGATALHDEALTRTRQAEIALAEAGRAFARAERLASAGGLAPRDLEQARDLVSLRERELEALRSRERAAAQDERRAVAAAYDGGGSAREIAIRATLTGRVLRVFEEHARAVPAGTPILEIGDASAIEFQMEVLSADATAVRTGQRVLIAPQHGDTIDAMVTRVEPAAFTKTSALGIPEQRVRVTAKPTGWIPAVGDRFELPAAIVLWESDSALTVPASALVANDTGWSVLVVREGHARRQGVRVGRRGSTHLEVTAGLIAGDSVILRPSERTIDGTRVSATAR